MTEKHKFAHQDEAVLGVPCGAVQDMLWVHMQVEMQRNAARNLVVFISLVVICNIL